MIHICQANTIPGLEAEVNRMFDFVPIGGICADSGNFYLAMMHVQQPSSAPAPVKPVQIQTQTVDTHTTTTTNIPRRQTYGKASK
jgi:hypothetical protein